MKNKEYYKDKIYEIACAHDTFAIDKKTGEMMKCEDAECSNCLFRYLEGPSNFGTCQKFAVDWLEQEYVEPILDDIEKQYLESFIRPFKNRVRSITKRTDIGDYAYLRLRINSSFPCMQEELINLPIFAQNKMYRNMTAGKKYNLKDLRLFEDEGEDNEE